MPLSLSYDHRVVDGAAASRFLNEVIGYLESPGRLLLALSDILILGRRGDPSCLVLPRASAHRGHIITTTAKIISPNAAQSVGRIAFFKYNQLKITNTLIVITS